MMKRHRAPSRTLAARPGCSGPPGPRGPLPPGTRLPFRPDQAILVGMAEGLGVVGIVQQVSVQDVRGRRTGGGENLPEQLRVGTQGRGLPSGVRESETPEAGKGGSRGLEPAWSRNRPLGLNALQDAVRTRGQYSTDVPGAQRRETSRLYPPQRCAGERRPFPRLSRRSPLQPGNAAGTRRAGRPRQRRR